MTKNNLYAKYIAVETQEYSSHVISGSKTTRRARSQMGLKTCLGLFC